MSNRAKPNEIVLPVSLGEALDKLTILDIKLQKIKDSRRQDVQKEYDTLFSALKAYVEAFPYHYRILRDVNLLIWETQDKFHGKDTTPEQGAVLCRQILLDNDRRFRVKAKINALANSELREQKGYAAKKALFYGHLGLGDMFWMNGAVRYLSTAFDEVYVICKRRNERNAAAMYADDPSIKLVVIDNDAEDNPNFMESMINWYIEQGYAYISCGFFAQKETPEIYDLPNSFYDDLGIPREVRTSYFYVPRTPEARELAAHVRLVAGNRPYTVLHQQSSVQTLSIYGALRTAERDRLILDLNENHYPRDHPDWEVAECVVNKPLLDYTYLIEGADELHMIESSIYCLASHLDLSGVRRRVCYAPWDGNAERLGVFETGVPPAAAVQA